jgi:outer membrane receptor for ferric coprogen and ferric-rhodotorulic acid
MILKVTIDEKTFPLELDQSMISSAQDMFAKMDTDMDQGWQMSRTWVEAPNDLQRCQIAADKMLTAIQQEKTATVGLMAAYIMHKIPGVQAVDIDTSGDMTLTELAVS